LSRNKEGCPGEEKKDKDCEASALKPTRSLV